MKMDHKCGSNATQLETGSGPELAGDNKTSASAKRARIARERRHRGVIMVQVEVDKADVAAMIHRGYLDPSATGDRGAIAQALKAILNEFADRASRSERQLCGAPERSTEMGALNEQDTDARHAGHDAPPIRNASPLPPARPGGPRRILTPAAQRAFIRSYLATGRWSHEWGPPPGHPDCWVDREILHENADALAALGVDLSAAVADA